MAKKRPNSNASAGHRLGQLVGDWFEEYFVLPLLESVSAKLRLYLDHRFRARPVRGDRIVWIDDEGNTVDYDFVMELNGTDDQLGIPVAFFECFWRRGSRHSKDKARDDSGKLLPMRSVHPTARFLGIVAAGDFTNPARLLVRSRDIDLFYTPKVKVVTAFSNLGMQVDYPDKSTEKTKQKLATKFASQLTASMKRKAASELRKLIGDASIRSYVDRVRGAMGALPQEIRVKARRDSSPRIFETIPDATNFIASPNFDFSDPSETFVYEITYTDGTEFERVADTLDDLRSLHGELEVLAAHMDMLQAD